MSFSGIEDIHSFKSFVSLGEFSFQVFFRLSSCVNYSSGCPVELSGRSESGGST